MALEAPLLLRGSLRGGDRLEALVRNGLAALDGQPVRAIVEPGHRALDSGQLVQQALAQARLELVVVELGALVAEVLVHGRELAVAAARLLGQRPLDSPPFLLEKLACPVRVHVLTLPVAGLDAALV